MCTQLAPSNESCLSGLDGDIDVFGQCLMHKANLLVRGGIDESELLALLAWNELGRVQTSSNVHSARYATHYTSLFMKSPFSKFMV